MTTDSFFDNYNSLELPQERHQYEADDEQEILVKQL
jgi:hypothetical protein